MDSGDFKEQLEKDIAYANSPFHEIRVECDEGSGQVITETILSKKVTDKFTVEFKISSGYSFSGWKAYSKSSDGKLADLSDKNIKFSSYNTESGDGIFKTTVEFVSKADGVIIKPECILLPFVKEIEPKFESAGCDQDSQVKITFNKAVNPESFGDFSCIQLYSDSADLTGCFGTPGFSSDNTALYIPTVKEKLILRPDDASRETLNISVRYDFSGIKDCDGLSLSQSGAHEYRINKNFGNQQKVTVQMSGEDYGSFNAAERECTVGYTFDLQFSLKKDSYVFKNSAKPFEAVSGTDKSVSRGDSVSFELLESDGQNGSCKVRVTVLEKCDDILIVPACSLIPKVSEITPKFESAGCDQDSQIKISFNKAVNPESFGDFSCIQVYSDSRDLFSAKAGESYFGTPYFSSDNTSLYIPTVKDKLILNPMDASVSFLDVKVKYDFSGVRDADGLELSQSGSHEYRINKNFGGARKVSLQVQSDAKYGSFLSAGEKECLVGYSIDLQYTVKKEDYKFLGLEAVGADGAAKREQIAFTQLEANETSGIYKYRVSVNAEYPDVVIRPVCVLLPKALSASPAYDNAGYRQDTSIKINFNKAVNLSDFAEADGSLKNITIMSGETNLLDTKDGKLPYYRNPSLENEGKTLVIPIVKGNYIIKEPNQTREITVTMNLAGLTDGVSGENAAFAQAEYSFTFKINSEKDNTPPLFKTLNIARTEEDARNGTNLITIEEFVSYATKVNYGGDSAKVAENIQNHHVNKVWIYFEAEDADSGASSLEIREQQIRKTNGEETLGLFYDKTSNLTANFFENTTGANAFSGCFEYNFKSVEDGVVKLEVALKDRAENCTTQKVDLVKDTICGISCMLMGNKDSTVKTVDDSSEAKQSFNLSIASGGIFAKDMDGTNHCDEVFKDNGNDSFSIMPDIAVVFEYGGSDDDMTSIDFCNYTFHSTNGTAKQCNLEVNYNPYKTTNVKIIAKDAVGNSKTISTGVIPASVDVISCNPKSYGGLELILSQAPDDSGDIYYSLNNGELRGARRYRSPTADIIQDLHYSSSYEAGTYKFYFVPENNLACAYAGKPITVIKDENGWHTQNSEQTLTQNDIPSFDILLDDPVLNTGTRTVHVKYDENFVFNSNYSYLIYYKSQATNNPDEGFTVLKNFTVKSQYCDYIFKAVVVDNNGNRLESNPITKDLSYDNVSPVDATYYVPKDVIPQKNVILFKGIHQDLGVGLAENSEGNPYIKYYLSDSYTLAGQIDWNNAGIVSTSIQNADSYFPVYIYGKTFSYIYFYLEDKNGNSQESRYLCRYSTLHPRISQSDGKWYLSAGQKMTAKYLTVNPDEDYDDLIWLDIQNNNQTSAELTADELKGFLKVQPYKNDTRGEITCYSGSYYYLPYRAGKTGACELKDLYIGKAGVNILADQPCFAHTMYCPYNRGDTPEAWLDGGFETGLVMKQKSFTYSNSNTSEVPAGYYYTTVVHFADGTVLMSDVKQK